MAHIVVAVLLTVIIVVAGWLIAFCSNLARRRSMIEESRKVLAHQFRKRNELILQALESLDDQHKTSLEGVAKIKQLVDYWPDEGDTGSYVQPCMEAGACISELLGVLPTLQSDGTNNLLMHHELAELEERVVVCQRIYTERVQQYNKLLTTFPNNVAKLLLGVQEMSCG